MKKFALLGKKLGHSLSSIIHNELFRLSGYDGEYFLAPSDSVQDFLTKNQNLEGFNITIPFKQDVVPFCKSLHESAKNLGVVNCVDSNMVGYNTDVYGYCASVSEIMPRFDCNVLLLGCGGVGSMIAKQYQSQNLTIALRNLSEEKKLEFEAKYPNADIVDIKDIPQKPFDLVVNSTPCGMYPDVDSSPIKKELLKNCKAVYDTIYNPYDTTMLKYAKSLEIPCKNGLDMLVLQAVKSHEYWYGATFDDLQIENVLKLTKKVLEER